MSLRSSPLVIAIDVGGTWAELIGVDNKRAAREIATLPDKARVVPAAGSGVWIGARSGIRPSAPISTPMRYVISLLCLSLIVR